MMNKYQASLSCIKYYCGHYNKAVETAISNLQELVNIDKPKKAIYITYTYRILQKKKMSEKSSDISVSLFLHRANCSDIRLTNPQNVLR